MAQSRAPLFEAIKAAGPTRADSVARLEALSRLLDSAFQIPGTNHRVGIDALLGLIPGIGDLVSTALSSYIIWEARQLGLPRWKIARMIGNVAVDTAVGASPCTQMVSICTGMRFPVTVVMALSCTMRTTRSAAASASCRTDPGFF